MPVLGMFSAFPTTTGVLMQFDPEYMKRNWAKILKLAVFKLPFFWQKKMVPGHFKPGAEAKYNYKPRTDAYLRRKQKAKGHQNPLAFNWAAKNDITSRAPSVTGSAKAVTAKWSMPWYIKMVPVGRDAPALSAEIKSMTKREAWLQMGFVKTELFKELERRKSASTKKRRIR